MIVELVMTGTDIKKIFARTEGDLIHGEMDHIIYSTRTMLTSLFNQLPESLKQEIRIQYPRTASKIE